MFTECTPFTTNAFIGDDRDHLLLPWYNVSCSHPARRSSPALGGLRWVGSRGGSPRCL